MNEIFYIYEEGFMASGMDAPVKAHFVGVARGNDFIDACKNYISDGHHGTIGRDFNGNEYAHDWGCRWFPTLEDAQKSFG